MRSIPTSARMCMSVIVRVIEVLTGWSSGSCSGGHRCHGLVKLSAVGRGGPKISPGTLGSPWGVNSGNFGVGGRSGGSSVAALEAWCRIGRSRLGAGADLGSREWPDQHQGQN